MQTLSSALAAAMIATPRVLVDLFEFYESDYVPGVSGFDPADAIEAFAAETITWNGNAYRREVVSRGDITRNMGEKTNQCTLTFSNITRYMATLATTQQIEGLFLVIRTVVPSVTDDSIVLFVGRCDKPSDINKEKFTLNARQDFGNINQEIPPREFTAEDPIGRTPSDPLYEGFRLTAIQGSNAIPFQTPSTSFFGRLFGRQRTEYRTQQWSSLDSTPYGSVLAIIFGRCQMELIPIFFADIGYALIGVWAIGEGRVDDFDQVRVRDSRFAVVTEEDHMGDPGGTLTNATNTSGPISQGYLSKTAYVVLSMSGTTNDVEDDAPLITAIVKGVRVPLPNSSGVYGTAGWSDNPVHIARFVLSDSRLVGINSGFMEDSVNYQTGLHCDEPIIDDSNGETTLVMQADLPQAGTEIKRSRSTGILDARYFKFNYLGDTSIVPEFEDPSFEPIDPGDIPTVFPITRYLRKRYTANVPLTEKMRAVDFLYKVLFPCAKLFLRINKRGKYEIRSEKPSDATYAYNATVVGATAISVRDVTPWKTGDLLQGRIQFGFGLTTSEVRDVSSATYTADGNSIPLTTSVTGGGVTSMASGATLAGGSTTVQASGTITVGGTPAAGNTVTATINSVAVTYTLTADDTTGTTAAMLAAYINATPRLNKYIRASWSSASPTIVTVTALLGVLNVSSALLKAHTAKTVDPVSFSSTLTATTGGLLAAGTYKITYADVTALGKTAISPTSSVVIGPSSTNRFTVTSNPAFPATVVSRNYYMSDAADSDYLRLVASVTTNANFAIADVPLPGAAMPPQYNTTGEEVIRIARSFSTNSQDVYSVWPASTLLILNDIYLPSVPNGHKYQVTTAGTTGASEPTWPLTAGGTVASGSAIFTEIGATILGQTGLLRANIKIDTFSFPLGSRQSSVNQVKISYRDSNHDFAKTPFRVNDPAHQALVNKIYPMEVNGEAIDNFSQMYRIANWQLAKNREGDWFYTFGTGPEGLILEEGDIICASDDSGGLVNQVCRIEEIRIHSNHDVTIGQARKYSTNMFSDDVAADVIPVPTTLRYVQTVDSLVEFIDNHPHRDDWGITAGFGVVMSRDLTIEGDWRGASLYADYGDGYVKIAETNIPAVIGEATTTLGTPSDPAIPDETNSVTFTLKYGAPAPSPQPFDTVTAEDLLINPYRNLFLIGDEYAQAATVVFNGGQSYTISDLLRGRFGTDAFQLTHVATERVVFLNGAEQFIPIPLSALNHAHNYKAVTTNQDVADATAIPFTWTGGNLKPLAISNPRGTRDSGDDLLIEFEGRTRMGGGLRSFQAGASHEEIEEYRVQILDGGSTTLPNGLERLMTVIPGTQLAAFLEGEVDFTGIDHNTLDPFPITRTARSAQEIHQEGNFIEAGLQVDLTAVGGNWAAIGLQRVGGNWIGLATALAADFTTGGFTPTLDAAATIPYWVILEAKGASQFLSVYEYGVLIFSASSKLTDPEYDPEFGWAETIADIAFFRARFSFVGSSIRISKAHTKLVPLTTVAVSNRTSEFPYFAVAAGGIAASSKISKVIMTTHPFPKTIYGNTQETEDGFTPGDPVEMDIYQWSPVVGPGDKTRVTL